MFQEMRNPDHSLFERGKGNQCSVEVSNYPFFPNLMFLIIPGQFNCLYRWHATTSQADEQWAGQIFTNIFPDKPADEVTVDDFKTAAFKLQQLQPDLTHWTFGK
jgi:linoleate 10R-lipoxygenase